MFYKTKADALTALSGIWFEPFPPGGGSPKGGPAPLADPQRRGFMGRVLKLLRGGGAKAPAVPVEPEPDRFTRDVLQGIVEAARPGARLIPARGSTSGLRSRVGGLPDLPPGAPWPTDPPISFLGQFDFSELNGEGQIPDLPTSGLLSLYFDTVRMPGDWELEDGVDVKTVWDPDPGLLVQAKAPAALTTTERGVFQSIAIKALHGVFIPDGSDRSYEELDLQDPFDLEYTEWHADVTHYALRVDHRLGGRIHTIQNGMQEECPKTGVFTAPLLQLDSDPGSGMTFGDLGTIYLWIWPQDLEAGRLDRAKLWWQTS